MTFKTPQDNPNPTRYCPGCEWQGGDLKSSYQSRSYFACPRCSGPTRLFAPPWRNAAAWCGLAIWLALLAGSAWLFWGMAWKGGY